MNLAMTDPGSSICARIAQSAYFGPLPASQSMCDGIAVDPFSLLSKAATGDISAQRELADHAACLVLDWSGDIDPLITLAEGLMFARMAAVQGGPEDEMRVVSMLSLAAMLGEGDAAREYAGEAIARLELLADIGGPIGESAGELLAGCAGREAPDTLELAKDYRARLGDARAVMRASVPIVPSVPEVS